MYSPGCGIPELGCYEMKMKSILPCVGKQTAEKPQAEVTVSTEGCRPHQPYSWPRTICIHELPAVHCPPRGAAPTHIAAPTPSHPTATSWLWDHCSCSAAAPLRRHSPQYHECTSELSASHRSRSPYVICAAAAHPHLIGLAASWETPRCGIRGGEGDVGLRTGICGAGFPLPLSQTFLTSPLLLIAQIKKIRRFGPAAPALHNRERRNAAVPSPPAAVGTAGAAGRGGRGGAGRGCTQRCQRRPGGMPPTPPAGGSTKRCLLPGAREAEQPRAHLPSSPPPFPPPGASLGLSPAGRRGWRWGAAWARLGSRERRGIVERGGRGGGGGDRKGHAVPVPAAGGALPSRGSGAAPGPGPHRLRAEVFRSRPTRTFPAAQSRFPSRCRSGRASDAIRTCN